jgi:molybdopterin-containing oxidoreductase family membrane subunit
VSSSVHSSQVSQEETTAVLAPGHSLGSVSDKIGDIVLHRRTGRYELAAFALAFLVMMLFFYAIGYLFARGVGIWGINIPVAWGFAIANFVWWIGIGHAGTFISAFLLLMRRQWRTSINRFAEAMTLFAVACAGLMPLLHLGRPWYFYWLIPYPNAMSLWPQFRSPLVWDVFAVATYAAVSLVFWYVGLIPDLAALRDCSRRRITACLFGLLALGWRNSARHWRRYQMAYLLLAGLATPLVISVHSIVGLDFTVAQVPGWHSPIFPPYFVAGAIFSGFAMVLTLAIPMRALLGLKDMITLRHLENCATLMLVTGLIVAYGYAMEHYMGWYSHSPFELYLIFNRMTGPYAPAFWTMMACNVVVPQLLWFRAIRRNVRVLFVISLLVNVGMWLERFVIVVVSLHREFMPSSWGLFKPTFWDYAILFGSMGLFASLFYLFVRLLPVISISEMRELVHETGHSQGGGLPRTAGESP